MYASTAKGTPQNQANIGVGGGNMSIGTDGAVNANGFDPAWAPPPITDVIPPEPIPMPSCPCYTLRYDGDGPGMDMAWTWGQLGIVDVTFNDLGFLLAIWLEDTSGNKSTVSWLNVAKETYGDFMLPVVAGAADLNHIASINIDIDPNFGGDIVFGGVAVPEPSNAALAIGGLCFVGFLGRRFLKK